MRLAKLLLAALALSAWASGPLAGTAGAQDLGPQYQSSDPERDAMMDEAPSQVTVTFSQPLDESSAMSVVDDCGNEIDAGAATVDVDEMTVGIAKTPAGMYKVVYKAVGLGGAASSSGSFEFMVHEGTPCKGGHTNHDPKKHPKKHGNGRGDDHGNHGGGGRDHDDHSTGGTGHSGHDTGSTGSTGHSGHDMDDMGGMGGMDHRPGKGHDEHEKHTPRDPGGDVPPQATGGLTPLRADAQAMLVGLGLALAVGVLGGWLLRMSGNLTA